MPGRRQSVAARKRHNTANGGSALQRNHRKKVFKTASEDSACSDPPKEEPKEFLQIAKKKISLSSPPQPSLEPSGVLTPVQEISMEDAASMKSIHSNKNSQEEPPKKVIEETPKEEKKKQDEIVPDPVPNDPVPLPSTPRPSPRHKFIGVAKTMSFLKKANRVADASQAQSEFLSRHGMSYNVKEKQEEQQFKGGRLKYVWMEWICDKSSDFHYWWTLIISLAFLYNLLVVVARIVFVELSEGYFQFLWLIGDLSTDSIYLIDMWIKSRTGFLEQGLLVRDLAKVRKAYIKSAQFKQDIGSLFPVDMLGNIANWSFGRLTTKAYVYPSFRFNRLGRFHRMQEFMSRTETRSAWPNCFRVASVIGYIIVLIHWNACFYFLISSIIGIGSDEWVYGVLNKQSLPPGVEDTLTRRYIYSFYWSTLILTTIGEVPWPVHSIEFVYVAVDLMCGVLIFAIIVGNVGNTISNVGAAKQNFQNKMDGIKQYMNLRNVSKQLQARVIRWFDYLWANKQGITDSEVLKFLPDKLQAEIAMHVHFETLRKVRVFQDCESGLLAELVLKLQLQVFSPNDYVCKRGDIGREMYIVKRGKLKITKDDGKIIAVMSEGSVFGELSILNIPGSKNGNRRTANIISIGYTDLFVLSKNDLMSALKEYPEAKNMLMKRGREILMRDNLLDESAPEESRSAEEICEFLSTRVKLVQLKIARLTAEYTSTSYKLKERVQYLERQLARYGVIEELGECS